MNHLTGIAVTLSLLLSVFLIGRYTAPAQEAKKEVIYKACEPISVEFDRPLALSINVPIVPKYLFYTDTVAGIQHIDTAAILADWIAERRYELEAFCIDTIGKLDVMAIVQYNELQHISTTFIPVQREVQSIMEKPPNSWQPYAMLGIGNTFSIEGGIFYRKVGIGLSISSMGSINAKIGYRF
jgi:hypothetical protein